MLKAESRYAQTVQSNKVFAIWIRFESVAKASTKQICQVLRAGKTLPVAKALVANWKN